jgi:hypothetical protein
MLKLLPILAFVFLTSLLFPEIIKAQSCPPGHLPGDGNGDCTVDGIDYGIWFVNYGTSGKLVSEGNYNEDAAGVVDGLDYGVWFVNYGKSVNPPSLGIFNGVNEGETVSGDIFVTYEADTTVTQGVKFYIDGNFVREEVAYPYALGGDSGVGNVHPYDTTQLTNGTHTLAVTVTRTDLTTYQDQLSFTVNNSQSTQTPTNTKAPTLSPTKTPTPTSGATSTPTPTTPIGGVPCSSLSGVERRFPCSPLVAGPMPEKTSSGTDAWDMFTNILYTGVSDGDGVNERFSAVVNPVGSGVVVRNMNVVADSEGHTTVGTGRSLPIGTTECSAFRWLWYTPSDLQQSSWVLVWQLQMSGSPIVAVEVDQSTHNWAFRTRNGSDSGLEIILTPVNYGHWSYFVVCTHLAEAPNGWTKIWFKHDGWPDVDQAPFYQRSGHDTYQGRTGHNTIGIYAGGSGSSIYYGYFDRYGRATSPQRAIQIAGNP